MNLNRDHIRMLAEAERKMDSGETPFVFLDGRRVSVCAKCMEEFGLERGQTITGVIFMEILKWNIVDLEAQIEERKFQDKRGDA